MKNYLAILIVTLLLGCNSHGQNNKVEFEGTILYSVTVKSKNADVISDEEVQDSFGDSLIFYFKRGKYRMSFNGKDLSDVYYFTDSNVEYTLRNNIDTLFYGDCSRVIDEFGKLIKFNSNETICGHKCSGIEVSSNKSKRTFLFSEDLHINPLDFEKYIMGNFNRYYAEAQAPFLLYIYDGISFTTNYRAIKIEAKKLDDQFFDLPALPMKGFN